MHLCTNRCTQPRKDEMYEKVRRADHQNAYGRGLRFCRKCTVFVKGGGKFCPCCGDPLRIRPRNRNRGKDTRRRVPTDYYKTDKGAD